ncbi:MAG: hypothetical protein EX285_05365, partial [Thaumarchaeota archaeon]|nr:hypothetical protein [Nitrososphaerota archaeon]
MVSSKYIFLSIGIGIAIAIVIGFGILNSTESNLETRMEIEKEISKPVPELEATDEGTYIYSFGKESVSIIDPLNNNIILQLDVPYTVWPANH